jgi:tyrosinase
MIVVRGIKTRDANGKPYLRQDIDKWYMEQMAGDRIQLTLFVEALAPIQRRDLDDLKSYFRLAAIHSAPWCEWDDVPQAQREPGERGYCVHSNYTFPTWHRVYMMLYEVRQSRRLGETVNWYVTDTFMQRTLYEAMLEWIHEAVPESHKDIWRKEADKWRLPYWDFARFADRPPSTAGALPHDIDHDQLRLPILCMMPNVRITLFTKDSGPIIESRPNPLYKYITPQLMGEFRDPYKIRGETTEPDPNDKVQTPKFTLQVKSFVTLASTQRNR